MKFVRKLFTNALPTHALTALLSVSPYAAYGHDDVEYHNSGGADDHALNLDELTEFSDTYAQDNPPLNIDIGKAPPVYISVDDQGRAYAVQVSYDGSVYSFVTLYLTDDDLAELWADYQAAYSPIFEKAPDIILDQDGTLTTWFPGFDLKSLQNGIEAAGQWKPVCIEGGICSMAQVSNKYQDRHAMAPLVVGDQLWLKYTLVAENLQNNYSRQIFSLSAEQPPTPRLMPSVAWNIAASVAWNLTMSLALDNDTVMSSSLHSATVYDASLESPEQLFSVYWNGTDPNLNPAALNNQLVIGPPVQLNGTIYFGATGTGLYKSDNGGLNWERILSTWEYIPVTWDYDRDSYSPFPSGGDRFHLGVNSDKSALWYLGQTWRDPEATLFQSTDQGKSWTRIDDGSFPQDAMKIVHDPSYAGSSYAVTLNGLYVSGDSGVSWQLTGLQEAVHGVVFVERIAPLGRVLVAGTDTGVKVSIDEGATWKDMSAGLLSIPHTVSHVDGILLATSDAGYFSCNAVDCAGDGQGVGSEEELGQVTVVEFFNTDLNHYFLTASMAETQAIENGAAGPGWLRTGETFQAWSVLPAKTEQGWEIPPYYGTNAMIVCRFYGSTDPGPNSHFYTVNTDECGALIDLQQQTPENKPRWNLESYAFAVAPKQTDASQPCLDDMVPVYRLYNDAFKRGEDSNHRYVTDPALLEPMVLEGWVEEGVVFCAAQP